MSIAGWGPLWSPHMRILWVCLKLGYTPTFYGHIYGHVTGKWSSNPLELGIYHFPNSKSNESKVIIENLLIPWKFVSFLISKPYLRPSQDVWVRLSVPTSRPRRPSAPVAPTPLLWASWTHRLGAKVRAEQLKMCWEWWCYPINEGF